MASKSNKVTRRQHSFRVPADRSHYQQPSIKEEAKRFAIERGVSMDEAVDQIILDRREYARRLAEDAKARRAATQATGKTNRQGQKIDVADPDQVTAMKPIRFESIDGAKPGKDANAPTNPVFAIDPAKVTRTAVEKFEARAKAEIERKAAEKERSRQLRIQLRDSLVLRADAFAAFVLILEKKGIPAHVIDERKFAAITTQKRWDLVPAILAWMVREDLEVKVAFQAFCDAAKKCTENLRVGVSKVSRQAGEIISEKYREMFLQAASIYARKLSHLESSLDRLDILPLDELQTLVDDGDQLSKRIADLSLRVADELKRREAKKGAATKDEKFDPIRKFALNLANDGSYPSRRQAVLAIKEQVLTYATSLGVSMSVQQSDKTIDGWLKDLGYTPSASKRGTSTS